MKKAIELKNLLNKIKRAMEVNRQNISLHCKIKYGTIGINSYHWPQRVGTQATLLPGLLAGMHLQQHFINNME